MARRLCAIIMGVAVSAYASFAQVSTPPSAKAEAESPAPRPGKRSAEFGNLRRAFEGLTPKQRQNFIENLKRWSNLPPEDKKALADREGTRRKKIAAAIDTALSDSGLNLEGERRALFAKRYAAERRKVEEQLRKEAEEKRQALLKEVVERLKAEFSADAINQ